MISKRAMFSGAATALGLLIAAEAHAQSAGASNSAEVHNAGELDEVIVTARRRSERLQDVPIAVSAFTGQALAEANVTRVDEISRIAPGFVAQTSPYGNTALIMTLRSQRQLLPGLTYDQSVGIYFAEVTIARTQGANGSLYDLESLQVLKGPQGTLFGRNTTGGALIITPRAPGPVFGGYLTGTLGTHNTYRIEGAVDLPVNDKLQIRLAAQHREHEGYVRVLNSNKRLGCELIKLGGKRRIMIHPRRRCEHGIAEALRADRLRVVDHRAAVAEQAAGRAAGG
jgi:iron complex outermembrane receptor protein